MTAITITDLENAKLDVDHIASIATSTGATATDRLGNVKSTIKGATDSLAADVAEVEARKVTALAIDIPAAIATVAAINNRGAWAATTAYALKDIALTSGTWYMCVVAHTSSALFATDAASKWRVYQGVVAADLEAGTGITGLKIGTAAQAGTISVNHTRTSINNHAFEDWGTLAITSGPSLGYCSFDAKPTMTNTVAEDHLIAFQARQIFNGAGNLATAMDGYWCSMSHTGSGTVANASGVRVKAITGAGPITNLYGMYIENLARAGTTTYGIYSLTGVNYLAGKTGFGTTTSPVYKIDVGGTDSDGIRYSGTTAGVFLGSETTGGRCGTLTAHDFNLIRSNVVIATVMTNGLQLAGTKANIFFKKADGTNGLQMGRAIGGDDANDFFIYDTVAGTVPYQYSAATGNKFGGTKFGVNGATPQAKATVNAACSDLATSVALINQLRAALVANGICI